MDNFQAYARSEAVLLRPKLARGGKLPGLPPILYYNLENVNIDIKIIYDMMVVLLKCECVIDNVIVSYRRFTDMPETCMMSASEWDTVS
jgi:hypothetical protein